MHAINLIARHLNPENLKLKVFDTETNCAFTGLPISKGVKVSDLVSDVFTDYAYVRHGQYASIDAALCIAEVVPTEKGFNSMRNYSYFCTESELRFLKREDIFDLLINLNETKFVLSVSHDFKKHTTYKSSLSFNSDKFIITTDLYACEFDREKVMDFLPIIQRMYSDVPNTKYTYFTKKEILTGVVSNTDKINKYGIDAFMEENTYLNRYRNTHLFHFIIHILNKCST